MKTMETWNISIKKECVECHGTGETVRIELIIDILDTVLRLDLVNSTATKGAKMQAIALIQNQFDLNWNQAQEIVEKATILLQAIDRNVNGKAVDDILTELANSAT